eukprot:s1184_g23.t1
MRSDGILTGMITRSKTSGAGKRVEVMHFFVDKGAYFLRPDWLLTGWTLNTWMSTQAGMVDRDYLAPMPNPDLSGFRRAMVKYADAASMSRALFVKLRVDVRTTERDQDLEGVDTTLVFPESLGFWSEHSERGTMDTWMQVAGAAPEIRRMVGRWSVSEEEEYLRNLEAGVTRAQREVALMFQEWATDRPAFGDFERQVAGDLRRFLEARGVAEERIALQLDRLSVDLRAEPVPPSEGERECWRQPGVHYRDYLLVGPDRPPLEAGDHECKDCFKRVLSVPQVVESETEMTSSSSSEDGEEAARGDA